MEATKEMTLQELAAAALAQRQQREAEIAAERKQEAEQHARKAFCKLTGWEPDEVDGNRIVADGIALRHVTYSGWATSVLYLEGECPKCGEMTYGDRAIHTLADLGEALVEEFKETFDHTCRRDDNEPARSLEERTTVALEKIVEALNVVALGGM